MKIGELANAAGMKAMTVRYYEQAGLLSEPERTSSNYRVYEIADVERLQFIKKSRNIGFSLDEINEILQLHDRKEPTCEHVRALLDRKLAHIDSLMRDLKGFRSELAKLKDSSGTMVDCQPSGGRICGIVERGELRISEHALTHMSSLKEKRRAG